MKKIILFLLFLFCCQRIFAGEIENTILSPSIELQNISKSTQGGYTLFDYRSTPSEFNYPFGKKLTLNDGRTVEYIVFEKTILS